MRHFIPRATITALFLLASQANAVVVTVDQLDPAIVAGGGTWGKFVQGGGSASIVDLTGQGGNLENNQPLPIGAVSVTTGAPNADRGEVGISADFGDASTILNSLMTGYSYYKVDNGPNEFAAPALKLSIFASGGTGDNFGQLVYEPNWNQGAGSQTPPTGDWQTIAIGSGTGAGDDSTGGWWWSGGFGQPSGAGGPPIKSAAEWAVLFDLDADFANARIVGVNVGVGTYNQNQIGYFDEVKLGIVGAQSTTWDFEPATVPEPAILALMGLGLAGIGFRRRQ